MIPYHPYKDDPYHCQECDDQLLLQRVMWTGRTGQRGRRPCLWAQLPSAPRHVSAEQGSGHSRRCHDPCMDVLVGTDRSLVLLSLSFSVTLSTAWRSPCWEVMGGRGDTEVISVAVSEANPSLQQQNKITNRCATSFVCIRSIILYPTFLAPFLLFSSSFKDRSLRDFISEVTPFRVKGVITFRSSSFFPLSTEKTHQM